jgi:DNA-binding beta-propeller fold protein YncE
LKDAFLGNQKLLSAKSPFFTRWVNAVSLCESPPYVGKRIAIGSKLVREVKVMFEIKESVANGKSVKAAFLVALAALFVVSSTPLGAYAADDTDVLSVEAILAFADDPTCVAVNEQTNLVYVGTKEGLVIISGENNTVLSEIAFDKDVGAVVVNPQNNLVYVGTWSNITVLDGATNAVLGTIEEQVYNYYELALNPNTNRLYIGDWTTLRGKCDAVQVYDALNFSLIATVNIPGSENNTYIQRVGVAVNVNTNGMYATWTGNDGTYLIDDNNMIVNATQTPLFDVAVMYNNATDYVYVGGAVLNGTDLQLVSANFTGQVEAIDAANNLLYTTQGYNVSCLNGTTHDALSSVKLQVLVWPALDPMAVNPATSKVYLVDYVSQQVLVMTRGNSTFP